MGFLKKIYLVIYFLAAPRGLWDLSSPTRDWTQTMAVKAQNPNHLATRELPAFLCLTYFTQYDNL